jgi:hypothetical protein
MRAGFMYLFRAYVKRRAFDTQRTGMVALSCDTWLAVQANCREMTELARLATKQLARLATKQKER